MMYCTIMGIDKIGSSLGGIGSSLDELCSSLGSTNTINVPKQVCLGTILEETEKCEKPDGTKVPVDVNGKVIRVGDQVAYAVTEGRSAALRVGIVKAVSKTKYDAPCVKIELPMKKYVHTDKKTYAGGHYEIVMSTRSVEPAGRMIIVGR